MASDPRNHSPTSKTRKKPKANHSDIHSDIYSVFIQKIQDAIKNNQINILEILDPISAAVRNVPNDSNLEEELRKKYDALFNSISQLLKTYGIPSLDVSIFNAHHFLPTRLELTQHYMYKNPESESVIVENILEVLSDLDPVELILLNLINEIIEKVDRNHKKIEGIESAIEWVREVAMGE